MFSQSGLRNSVLNTSGLVCLQLLQTLSPASLLNMQVVVLFSLSSNKQVDNIKIQK